MHNEQTDIMYCTPRLLKSGLLEIKKLDDNVEIRTKYNRGKILLNESAGIILDAVRSGKKNLKEVMSSVSNRYKDVDDDILAQDVIESLKALWSLGIVGWVGKNPFIEKIKTQNMECIKVTHDYSSTILKILKKTDYKTALIRFDGFNIPGIRYGLLNDQFMIYASVDDEDNLGSMVMVIKNQHYYDVIAVGSIDRFDPHEIRELLQFVFETVRAPLMTNILSNESLVDTFQDIGFTTVSILDGESKLGTVNLMCYGRENQ